MGLKKEIDKLKFDKRMVDWNLAHGIISAEELKQHMSSLPDSSSNLESDEDDDFDMDEEESDESEGAV